MSDGRLHGLELLSYKGPPRSILFNISERNISQTSVSSASVVLHWKVDGDNISRIVVTSNPALPCYGVNMTECEVREGKRELNETVQFEVEYSITVRADNCGGRQNGTKSDTLQLLLKGGSIRLLYGCKTSGSQACCLYLWSLVWPVTHSALRRVTLISICLSHIHTIAYACIFENIMCKPD